MSRPLTNWVEYHTHYQVEYIDHTELGSDIRHAEVQLRKPRNLFVCVSEEREEKGSRVGNALEP